MALIDKLDRTYTLTASISKDGIIAILRDRVEEANRKNSWFSFKRIDYKKVKVDDHRAVIRYNPGFQLWTTKGGSGIAGFIILYFATSGASTTIVAEVKLFKWPFWVLAFLLILFSCFLALLMKGMGKIISLTALWTMLLGSTYINVVINRYRLKIFNSCFGRYRYSRRIDKEEMKSQLFV